MLSNRGLVVAVFVVGLLAEAALASSCGSSGNTSTGTGGSTGTGTHTGGASSTGTLGTGGNLLDDRLRGRHELHDLRRLQRRRLRRGRLLPTRPRDVCGGVCCTGGTVCLFDACVTPGKNCHTANDCGAGPVLRDRARRREPTAARPTAGPTAASARSRSRSAGKCLPLPPVCPGDAGAPGRRGLHRRLRVPPARRAGRSTPSPKWTWGTRRRRRSPTSPTSGRRPRSAASTTATATARSTSSTRPCIVFVSGKGIDANTGKGTCCQCTEHDADRRATRACCACSTGATGAEIWSLDKASASSVGFAGISIAIGDIDGDGSSTSSRSPARATSCSIDANGNVKRTSDKPIPGSGDASLRLGRRARDRRHGRRRLPRDRLRRAPSSRRRAAPSRSQWTGAGGIGGGGIDQALEHVRRPRRRRRRPPRAARRQHRLQGRRHRRSGTAPTLPDGFPGVGDFDKDGKPEAVLVGQRQAVDPRRRDRRDRARPGRRSRAPAAAGRRRSPTSTATASRRSASRWRRSTRC